MKIADRIRLYQEYKVKNLWKFVNDWPYIQCVSLVKDYAKNVYKSPIWAFWGSAYNWYLNKNKTFNNQWKQVPYTAWMIPITWDILFWKPTPSNSYGHTAIAGDKNTTTTLDILEQNYVAWKSPHFWKWTWPASIMNRQRNYKDFVWVWRYIWQT